MGTNERPRLLVAMMSPRFVAVVSGFALAGFLAGRWSAAPVTPSLGSAEGPAKTASKAVAAREADLAIISDDGLGSGAKELEGFADSAGDGLPRARLVSCGPLLRQAVGTCMSEVDGTRAQPMVVDVLIEFSDPGEGRVREWTAVSQEAPSAALSECLRRELSALRWMHPGAEGRSWVRHAVRGEDVTSDGAP